MSQEGYKFQGVLKLCSGYKEIIHKIFEIYSILDNSNYCEENKTWKGKGCQLK